MKQDTFKTDVIFRKEKDNTILAAFPHDVWDLSGAVAYYAHVGQHGGADYSYFTEKTVPALESEYTDLKTELESIGYNLRIVKRRNYDKYLAALKAIQLDFIFTKVEENPLISKL